MEQDTRPVPLGTELARPDLPEQDYKLAKFSMRDWSLQNPWGNVASLGAYSEGFIMERSN